MLAATATTTTMRGQQSEEEEQERFLPPIRQILRRPHFDDANRQQQQHQSPTPISPSFLSPKVTVLSRSSQVGLPFSSVDEEAINGLQLREIGDECTWVLSSAKPGNGAEQLRDDDITTYWQSDGSHPHTITLYFSRRAEMNQIQFYLDYHLDESYTPKKIEIKAGSNINDLESVIEFELNEPNEWIKIPLILPGGKILKAFMLQIRLLSMHQNGRDTHVRSVKIFGSKKKDSNDAHVQNPFLHHDSGIFTVR